MFYLSFSNPNIRRQRFLEIGKQFLVKSKPSEILAGFAFASLAGVNRIIEELSSEEWNNAEKKFIIGTSQGLSEPAAIRRLLQESNMTVRMYVPGQKLTKNSLHAQPLFHAKTMLFSGGRSMSNLIFVSSANLTGSAIGYAPRNIECGQISLLTGSRGSEREVRSFKEWWTEIWKYSVPAINKKLEIYSRLRLESFERNPDTLLIAEASPNISNADHFWIEVGRASGIERHQIEFPEHLASFFGQPIKRRVDLTLRNDKQNWQHRPLSYKRTTYNVDIWRLGMPTVRMGGEAIQNRVIRFSRTSKTSEFRIEISDLGSNEAMTWMKECSLGGHVGQTRGANSRRYGYV